MQGTIPIDMLTLIEERLHIFCFNDDHMNHQVQTNLWATLLNNEDKCARFEGLSMRLRNYVNSFRLQKQNFCFFCNGDDHSTYNRVKSSVMHMLSKMELNIVFSASEANKNTASLITIIPQHWEDIPEKLSMSMLEEIETNLSNSATASLFVLDYHLATPLLRSFIETVMANANIAVYLFQALPSDSLDKPEVVQSITDHLRSRNVECYALDSAIDYEKLKGVEHVQF